MCTVSFIPVGSKVFVTSNRDESRHRLPAKPPMHYSCSNCEMVFPKDQDAGGSWIGLCNNGNAGVLLNGAFEAHERRDQYQKSRGIVFLEIMDSEDVLQKFMATSLSGIEPFTLILWQDNVLYECRWDQYETKSCKKATDNFPQIWSSSTLYNKEARKKRKGWFDEWLLENPSPGIDDILYFHRFGGDNKDKDKFFINKSARMLTVSITSIELDPLWGKMIYTDFTTGNINESELLFY